MAQDDDVFINELWDEQRRGETAGVCLVSPRELKRLLFIYDNATDLRLENARLLADKQVLEANISELLKDDRDVILDSRESGAKSLAISLCLTMARTRAARDSNQNQNENPCSEAGVPMGPVGCRCIAGTP